MESFDINKYSRQSETFRIIGIAMEIHRVLDKGFSEIVYKDAFEYEFKANDIFYEREKEYLINYKGTVLPHKFYADFVAYDEIILEIKSKKTVIEDHYNQVLNYLAIPNWKLG